jgi:hypothetical protein
LCLVWVFRLSTFRNHPPKVGPLCAPTTSFSHRQLPQWCSSQIAFEPSPVDRSALFPCILFGFPVFCFLCVFFFFFNFPLYFVLLGFPVFALVFLCVASFCLFRVFFSFYSSADLLRACFATLCPLLGFFLCPHCVELPTRPSVYEICLHAIGVKE